MGGVLCVRCTRYLLSVIVVRMCVEVAFKVLGGFVCKESE